MDGCRPVGLNLAVCANAWFVVNPAATEALIGDAPWYTALWHSLRLAALLGLGAAAFIGAITYSLWLALFVAAYALLYLLEAAAGWLLARNAEASWQGALRYKGPSLSPK